jgi:hypothetical protein
MMGAMIAIVSWLVIGIVVSATVLGLLGVPVKEKGFREREEYSFAFFCPLILGSVLWPAMLAVALAFFPARGLYRWAIKRSA